MKHTFTSLAIVIVIIITTFYHGAHYGGRTLTEPEINYAKTIFADAINFAEVQLAFDTIYNSGSSVTLGSMIHFKPDVEGFHPDLDMTQSSSTRYALIHELAHVYQYEHDGWSYIPKSLISQFFSFLRTGSRDNAYIWEDRVLDKSEWAQWNPEEQAQAISDYSYYLELGQNAYSGDRAAIKELGCTVPALQIHFCTAN